MTHDGTQPVLARPLRQISGFAALAGAVALALAGCGPAQPKPEEQTPTPAAPEAPKPATPVVTDGEATPAGPGLEVSPDMIWSLIAEEDAATALFGLNDVEGVLALSCNALEPGLNIDAFGIEASLLTPGDPVAVTLGATALRLNAEVGESTLGPYLFTRTEISAPVLAGLAQGGPIRVEWRGRSLAIPQLTEGSVLQALSEACAKL